MSSTGATQVRTLDENSFQQMLAAAYVVQQHKDADKASSAPSTASQVLSAIAEIQSLIRARGLNIAESAAMIADRLLALSGASGVSISLVDNGYLDCVAEAGSPAKVPGSSISSHSLIATERLKAGAMFESENSQSDMRLDSALCQGVGVGSLVAAPVLRFGEIAGLVEVRWQKSHAFGDAELRTCRLMAGLVTGTLERSIRIGSARTPVAEQAITVDEPWSPEADSARDIPIDSASVAGERQKSLSDPPPVESAKETASQLGPVPTQPDPAAQPQAAKAEPTASCRMCGKPFTGDELFCGFCSMPRPKEVHEDLQSKWASMWFMQRAQGALHVEVAGAHASEARTRSAPSEQVIEPPVLPAEPKTVMWPRRLPEEVRATPAAFQEKPAVREEVFPFDERPMFSDRAGKVGRRYWREAILAIVVAVLAYGLITAWPQSRTHPTWFQSLMFQLGVIHPPTKVFAGTPETRVWIDVHTQLYYCSGDDLYGKTPDGEFTTQYNAQSDGYQPASNITCP